MNICKTQRVSFPAKTWESLSSKYASCVILLFLALGAPQAALAAEHFLRAGATGSASGADWTNAYTCIPTDANLVRGDTYYIGPGDYRNCDGAAARDFNVMANGQVITFRRATVANHGAAGDWNASYGTGQAIFHPLRFKTDDWTLDGQTRTGLRSGYPISVRNIMPDGVTPYLTTGTVWDIGTGCKTCGVGGTSASNITIQYVETIGTRDLASPVLSENGIYLFGRSTAPLGSNINVNHCAIKLPGNSNITAYSISNFTEEYNWLAYNKSTSSSHAEGNALQGTWSNITVRYNVFEDMEGTAFIALPNSQIQHPSNLYVYGNVFMRSLDNPENFTGAIGNGIVAILSMTNLNGLYVYNNTIVNQQAGITGNPRLYIISHNSTTGSGILANFYAENNLWYNNSSMDNSSSPCSYCMGAYVWNHQAYFNTPAPNDTDSNRQVTSSNPFVNYSAKDFRLATPTRTGVTLSSPFNTDEEGLTRGTNGNWDRGAFQSGYSRPAPPSSLRTQ